MLTAKRIFIFLTLSFFSLFTQAQKISFSTLRGSWQVTGSRDLKVYKDDKLEFRGANANCYLKSLWTFDSDSTGYIDLKEQKNCSAKQSRFKYIMLESPGYGGPTYKLKVTWDDGGTEYLSMSSPDGNSKLTIGYSQHLSVTMGEFDVWINYFLKKKS